jgi:nucleoid DNA-binding protein
VLIKSELDQRVASTLGIPVRKVATVTDEFIHQLSCAIVDEGGFYLVSLGRLKVKFEKGSSNVRKDTENEPMRIKLYFSKSRTLKQLIERKFGIHKRTHDEAI